MSITHNQNTRIARKNFNNLDKIGELIFNIILSRKPHSLSINEIKELLIFCEAGEMEIDYFLTVCREINESPYDIKSEDLNKIYEIINYHKRSLKEFYLEASFNLFTCEERRHIQEKIIPQIIDHLDIHNNCDKRDIIYKLIYKYPGNYIKNIYKQVGVETGLSYAGVWKYINELEMEKEIITIGGPQGNYRYCFPNPEKIKNRQFYYNKYFGIKNVKLSDALTSFSVLEPKGPFYNLYRVENSENDLLLALPWGRDIDNQHKVEAYGELHEYEWLEKRGYRALSNNDERDVLLSYKVTDLDNYKNREIYTDDNNATITIA